MHRPFYVNINSTYYEKQLFSKMFSEKSSSEVAQSCPTLCDPWTVAYQAPPSMEFFGQEYWSGVPSPSPRYILEFVKCIHLYINMGFSGGSDSKESACSVGDQG